MKRVVKWIFSTHHITRDVYLMVWFLFIFLHDHCQRVYQCDCSNLLNLLGFQILLEFINYVFLTHSLLFIQYYLSTIVGDGSYSFLLIITQNV